MVGAYRMGLGRDIYKERGIEGFYMQVISTKTRVVSHDGKTVKMEDLLSLSSIKKIHTLL